MKAKKNIVLTNRSCSSLECNVSEDSILARLEALDSAANEPFGGISTRKTVERKLPHVAITEDMDEETLNSTVLSFFKTMRNLLDGKDDNLFSGTDSIPGFDDNEDEVSSSADRKFLKLIDSLEDEYDTAKINWDTSPEFISAWIEENDQMIRSVVEPFEKSLKGAMYSMEDLVQEAYLAIVSAFDTYNPTATTPPSKYFHKVVFNKMRELYRYYHADKRDGTDMCLSFESICVDGRDDKETDVATGRHKQIMSVFSEGSVEDAVFCNEIIEKVFGDVQGERKVILELAAMGYTQTEIGKYIGISQSLISYKLKTIRQDYREVV